MIQLVNFSSLAVHFSVVCELEDFHRTIFAFCCTFYFRSICTVLLHLFIYFWFLMFSSTQRGVGNENWIN